MSDAVDILDSREAGDKVIRGSALRSGAYVGGILLGLVSTPLMVRHLGVDDFGGFVAVSSLMFIANGLTEGGLDPAAGDFPLNHAVLGGKQLHRGADSTAVLVRPDMTRFIADALEELDEDETRQKFMALDAQSYGQPIDEKHFMEVWIALQNLKDFFAAAAENMEAVVFTAKLQA